MVSYAQPERAWPFSSRTMSGMREETETPPAQAFIPTFGPPASTKSGRWTSRKGLPPGRQDHRLHLSTSGAPRSGRRSLPAALSPSKRKSTGASCNGRRCERVPAAGFTEWQTLPDRVVTDNELSLEAPHRSFPQPVNPVAGGGWESATSSSALVVPPTRHRWSEPTAP